MTRREQDQNWNFGMNRSTTAAVLTIFMLAVAMTPSAQAQSFTVLHNFSDGADGRYPLAGPVIDGAGNLYGTASEGGDGQEGACYPNGCGTVFRLKRTHSGWIFTPIYDFQGNSDGAYPYGGVTLGPDGALYGTAELGGEDSSACGVAFSLRPPPAACKSALCQWTKTTLYSFKGNGVDDGCGPSAGVTFDEGGNFYGTTCGGGHGYGTVYELSPSAGGWTEAVLHIFRYNDGAYPEYGGLVFDPAGDLYGTTTLGGDIKCFSGNGCGVVFQLTPSGSGWTDNTLYFFEDGSDGAVSSGGVILDASGNLYGATATGGANGGGAVFELSPYGGSWVFGLLASPASGGQDGGTWGPLTRDKAGNLYGMTRDGGIYGGGSLYKLTPSDGGWTFTTIHDFFCATDGCGPQGSVVFDADGNLYGTAAYGGALNDGTVWEITP